MKKYLFSILISISGWAQGTTDLIEWSTSTVQNTSPGPGTMTIDNGPYRCYSGPYTPYIDKANNRILWGFPFNNCRIFNTHNREDYVYAHCNTGYSLLMITGTTSLWFYKVIFNGYDVPPYLQCKFKDMSTAGPMEGELTITSTKTQSGVRISPTSLTTTTNVKGEWHTGEITITATAVGTIEIRTTGGDVILSGKNNVYLPEGDIISIASPSNISTNGYKTQGVGRFRVSGTARKTGTTTYNMIVTYTTL